MVEKNLNNTAYAIGKSIKSSQQKANLVLRSIRGLPIENAVNVLQFSRRRISNIILKILNSAISNAENNHQLDIDKLFVKEAFVGKSLRMKRWRPRAKGRAASIIKPFSKVTIIVEERTKSNKENK